MTTDTPEEKASKKRTILNILAITGFIAAVLLVAWLSILFVRILPSMFSSLASLSDSLYRPSKNMTEIVLTGTTETILSGESITINWDESPSAGTFTFSHACVDGVAIEIINDEGDQPVRCDTTYSLGNVTSVTLRLTSTKSEDSTIPYTIAFVRTNDTNPLAEATSTLAVSSDIPLPPTLVVPEVTQPPIVTTAVPTTPAPSIPTRPAASVPFEYTYPVSNPYGYTDLAVRFVGMGEVRGGHFITQSSFSLNNENFFRFEVKNIGTKTSDVWDYTITLPDDSRSERTNRLPLKPNERAVITIQFTLDNKGDERVKITTNTRNDSTSRNNNLTWATDVR